MMKYVHLSDQSLPHVFLFRMRQVRGTSSMLGKQYAEVLAWVEREIPAGTWTMVNMTFRLRDDVSAMAMRLRWC